VSLRFALFGHPVQHSMSPAIHAAAYRALGLSHRYELVDLPDEAALAHAVAAVRRGEIAGANVTIPWKRAALALADRVDPVAASVGAANVLRRDADGRLVAHNTDIPALSREVAALVAEPETAVVLGSGGASIAAVAALRALGARVTVSARRWTPAVPRAQWAYAEAFVRLDAELVEWSAHTASVAEPLGRALRSADVIVQGTSAGMHGADSGAAVAEIVPWRQLRRGAVGYDLVYNPPDTEFVKAAHAAGVRASHGLGMLVGQAALSIELWLGVLPPLEPLREAAELALSRRRAG
jgi:shikimate dehydrogenase